MLCRKSSDFGLGFTVCVYITIAFTRLLSCQGSAESLCNIDNATCICVACAYHYASHTSCHVSLHVLPSISLFASLCRHVATGRLGLCVPCTVHACLTHLRLDVFPVAAVLKRSCCGQRSRQTHRGPRSRLHRLATLGPSPGCVSVCVRDLCLSVFACLCFCVWVRARLCVPDVSSLKLPYRLTFRFMHVPVRECLCEFVRDSECTHPAATLSAWLQSDVSTARTAGESGVGGGAEMIARVVHAALSPCLSASHLQRLVELEAVCRDTRTSVELMTMPAWIG